MPSMTTNKPTDSSLETLLRQLQENIPSASLGFPPPEEMHRLRTKFQAAKVESWNRKAQEEADRMQRLKDRVRAMLRKDRP
jgi:hypothetical protein